MADIQTHSADVLVIGSGPGGATTAAHLAEAGLDVLIVEEGEDLTLDSAESYSIAEMDQKYRNGGLNTTFGSTNVTYIEGRCVGGASEINAALYHRPQAQTVDDWALRFSVDHLNMRTLEPHFDTVEKSLSVSTRPDGVGPASQKLAEGASAMGWSSQEIPRFWKFEGDGAQRRGRRQSMSETMVPRARAAGARLLPGTRVTRLKLKGDRAVAAIATQAGQRVEINFKDVFVCCGAVHTPLVLRRSGITRNVGDSLRLHPMVRIAARFDEAINDPSFGVPVVQVDEFKPALTLGCSHSSLPHLALWLEGDANRRARLLDQWDRLAVFYVAAVGGGAGKIRNIPLVDEPFIRHDITQADLGLLGEGLYRLSQLLLAAGAREIFSPLAGGPSMHNQTDIRRLRGGLPASGANISTIHLFSSCPMGEDASRCATGSFGQVNDFLNVYVNDASLLPLSPGVNPQGTIIAVALRNIDHYLNSRSRS